MKTWSFFYKPYFGIINASTLFFARRRRNEKTFASACVTCYQFKVGMEWCIWDLGKLVGIGGCGFYWKKKRESGIGGGNWRVKWWLEDWKQRLRLRIRRKNKNWKTKDGDVCPNGLWRRLIMTPILHILINREEETMNIYHLGVILCQCSRVKPQFNVMLISCMLSMTLSSNSFGHTIVVNIFLNVILHHGVICCAT